MGIQKAEQVLLFCLLSAVGSSSSRGSLLLISSIHLVLSGKSMSDHKRIYKKIFLFKFYLIRMFRFVQIDIMILLDNQDCGGF